MGRLGEHPNIVQLHDLGDETGQPYMVMPVMTGGDVDSSPIVTGGVVYVGSLDNHLYALDAATGDLLWRYETGNGVYSSPGIDSGVVYVGSLDNYLYALEAATGDLLWRYKTGDTLHHKLWGQILRWATEGKLPTGLRLVKIGTDRARYDESEPVVVRAKFSKPDLTPMRDALVSAEIRAAGKVMRTGRLH